MRLALADQQEWQANKTKWPIANELSHRNELSMCDALIQYLASLVQAYPTTPAGEGSDRAATLSDALFASEKETINATIQALGAAKQHIDKRRKVAEKRKKAQAKKKEKKKAAAAATTTTTTDATTSEQQVPK
jgi:hypothetical protein